MLLCSDGNLLQTCPSRCSFTHFCRMEPPDSSPILGQRCVFNQLIRHTLVDTSPSSRITHRPLNRAKINEIERRFDDLFTRSPVPTVSLNPRTPIDRNHAGPAALLTIHITILRFWSNTTSNFGIWLQATRSLLQFSADPVTLDCSLPKRQLCLPSWSLTLCRKSPDLMIQARTHKAKIKPQTQHKQKSKRPNHPNHQRRENELLGKRQLRRKPNSKRPRSKRSNHQGFENERLLSEQPRNNRSKRPRLENERLRSEQPRNKSKSNQPRSKRPNHQGLDNEPLRSK